METEILSMEIQMALKESVPLVTVPSYEAAKAVTRALAMYSAGNPSQKDIKGSTYWYCSLAELVVLIDLPVDFSDKQAGTICRHFQLFTRRENDGWHVGWSQTQLDILNKAIK